MSEKKENYEAFARPLITGFRDKNFIKESQIILNLLRETSLSNVGYLESKHSIHLNLGRQFGKTIPHWTYRLYVCVQPKYYWRTVSLLIGLSQKAKFTWHFGKDLKSFAAPDKIVILADDLWELKRIINLLRPLLKGFRFHKLKFAEKTTKFALEKTGDGLYVGADPSFIYGVCWLKYRWVIEETAIKVNRNKGKIDNATEKLLNRLNVTTKHYGPLTLHPKKRNNRYLEEIWNQINS